MLTISVTDWASYSEVPKVTNHITLYYFMEAVMSGKKLVGIGMVGCVCVVIVGGVAWTVSKVCDNMASVIGSVCSRKISSLYGC